ncbi:MAG: protein kinase [Candidatus Promineifilaceae bacterium]
MTSHASQSDASGNHSRAGATLHAGRYRLREKLGQGGMGSVYLAEDTLLPGRLVAVKENADTSTEAQSQFKREALLLARLRHPNLPQVMDYFIEADGKQYLVMDYVPGENLMELMRQRQGPLPVAEALAHRRAGDAGAGLHAHLARSRKQGRCDPIIHRDIKPANIKRTPEGRVVLVDFGIAKVDGGTMTGTAVSAKALTPGYAPLEQYGGGTDARSDIYSLGATLYALLTGKAPPNATSLATGTPLPPPQTVNASVPATLATVVQRAMQQLPANRYQSIAEMQLALMGVGAAGKSSSAPTTREARRRTLTGSTIVALVLLLGAVLSLVGIGLLFLDTQNANLAPDQNGAATTMLTVAATPVRPTAQHPGNQNAPLAAEPNAGASMALPTKTTKTTATDVVAAPEPATRTLIPLPTSTVTSSPPPAVLPRPADATATAVAVAANLRAVGASLSAVLQPGNAPAVLPAPATIWAIVGSSGDRNLEQTWVKSADFPGDSIRSTWQDGYDVTLLTYGDNTWVYVASRLPDNPKQYFQTSEAFPGDLVRRQWQEDYDVTSIAYGDGIWALIMTKREQNLEQAFVTDPDFPGEKIRQYWEDGYSVTDLAYGAGSWVVIASKMPDDPLQRYATSTTFPGDAIQVLWADGFDVTSLAYGNGLWAYIVSTSNKDLLQTYATNDGFPDAKISELWSNGYDVTSLVNGVP